MPRGGGESACAFYSLPPSSLDDPGRPHPHQTELGPRLVGPEAFRSILKKSQEYLWHSLLGRVIPAAPCCPSSGPAIWRPGTLASSDCGKSTFGWAGWEAVFAVLSPLPLCKHTPHTLSHLLPHPTHPCMPPAWSLGCDQRRNSGGHCFLHIWPPAPANVAKQARGCWGQARGSAPSHVGMGQGHGEGQTVQEGKVVGLPEGRALAGSLPPVKGPGLGLGCPGLGPSSGHSGITGGDLPAGRQASQGLQGAQGRPHREGCGGPEMGRGY